MPPITTQYALNIKRRKSLKSVTHRAYGRMPCVLGSELAGCDQCSRFFSILTDAPAGSTAGSTGVDEPCVAGCRWTKPVVAICQWEHSELKYCAFLL
jgi:hypothetical protein